MSRSSLFWVIIIVLFLGAMRVFSPQLQPTSAIKYSDFLSEVSKNNIRSVTIDGASITGTLKSSADTFSVVGPDNLGSLIDDLKKKLDTFREFDSFRIAIVNGFCVKLCFN